MSPEKKHSIKHDTDIHLLMERGRRFRVGPQEPRWEAVFWGEDADGDIVAHQEKGHWRFVHFNIQKAIDQLVVGDLMSVSEIHTLEQDAIQSMGIRAD